MTINGQSSSDYHSVFMQDIRDSPGDDLPRLIYADWLEDTGDSARAEFIRIQCYLARTSPDDPNLPPLKRREEELLQIHGPLWRKPVPSWLRCGVYFRRGFIDHFDGPASAFFRDDITAFFRLAPAPTLALRGIRSPQVGILLTSPFITTLRGLDLLDPQGLTGVLLDNMTFNNATKLTALGLAGLPLSTWDLRNLLRNNWTVRLKRLSLVGCQLTDECLDLLFRWDGFGRLNLLDVSFNLLSPIGVLRLQAEMQQRVQIGRQYNSRSL